VRGAVINEDIPKLFGDLLGALLGRTSSFFSDVDKAVAVTLIATFLTYRSINLLNSPQALLSAAIGVATCLFQDFIPDLTGDGGGGTGPSRATATTGVGGAGCFAAGTPIRGPNGESIRIEDLRPGDEVLGEDGKPVVVEQTYIRSVRHLRELRYQGPEGAFRLDTTDEHRFWVEDESRWKTARDLVVGDVLRLSDGEKAVLTFSARTDQPVQVYNLDVSRGDGFFANDVLAHERCEDAPATLASLDKEVPR
jgi:hypothetical protein